MKKIIFVIGAARSGTHLLADTLSKNTDCTYLNEINDFWKQPFPFLKTDYIPDYYSTKIRAEKLRLKFIAKGKNDFLIEKTAANCLRLPFLYKMFPEAYFIHIVRDGREVSISARRKYYGDIRKITQDNINKENAPSRLGHLINQITHKYNTGLNPLSILVNAKRFIQMTLKEMNLIKYSFWGPRYPGSSHLFKHLSPIELAADQWQYSIMMIKNFISGNKDVKYHELTYEQLISEPDEVIKEIFEFLSIPSERKISHNINKAINKNHFPELEPYEQKKLISRIGFTLKNLNYIL